MRRFSQVLFFSLLLGFLPNHAFSQNKKSNDAEKAKQQQAQKLFDEAEKYYNIGDFAKALDGYKEAYILSSNPDLLFNMGQCYRKLEQYQEAITTYKSYLREVPNSPVQADVEARIAEVEKLFADNQVSKLVITSTPSGAEVRKGGASSRVLGVTPYTEEKLAVGEYHFTLTLEGYQPYEFDLNVEGGKEYLLPAELQKPTLVNDNILKLPPRNLSFSLGGDLLVRGNNNLDGAETGGLFDIELGYLQTRKNKQSMFGLTAALGFGQEADADNNNIGVLKVGASWAWRFSLTERLYLAPGFEAGFALVSPAAKVEGFRPTGFVRFRPTLTRSRSEQTQWIIRGLGAGFIFGGGLTIELFSLGFNYGFGKKK
jgi:tetratricopeptide (TPR) repeat protein